MILYRRFRLYTFALLTVLGTTAAAFLLRDTLTLANFTMVYLLVVVIVAIRSGTGPAVLTAVASFVCINFFLVTPYYTLIVADPRDVLDLAVFLIVASVAGRLAADARRQAFEARQREREQEILYRLTHAFNQLSEPTGVLEVLIRVMRKDLGARHAQILPFDKEIAGNAPNVYYMLLESGEVVYGTVQVSFELALSVPQVELLKTCISLAAMALQRIDLTERAAKSQQFEEADKLKTAILHAASHDLRTPITIIKTSASNLRQFHEQLSPQESAEITETIEHEVDQLDKLVGNLLDMSRLKAGALRLNCQLNSLEELAGDVAARVWQLTKQERVSLRFPEDMPMVEFDYGLLLQAVTNIVDNSLRYEPAESQIQLHGTFDKDYATLRIINHGETITDDVKAHMMEPFYRGGGDGRTGLGLPIALGIIEAHKGFLRVEDTPVTGATFVITLPMKGGTHEAQNPGG